jgi:hypothetical protein
VSLDSNGLLAAPNFTSEQESGAATSSALTTPTGGPDPFCDEFGIDPGRSGREAALQLNPPVTMVPVFAPSPPEPGHPEPRKPKRSTQRGEGREKLIPALLAHHKYENGGCTKFEPIGNNELARKAVVAPATASGFFKKEFAGHDKYKAMCHRSSSELAFALRLINGDVAPHQIFSRSLPSEVEQDDER